MKADLTDKDLVVRDFMKLAILLDNFADPLAAMHSPRQVSLEALTHFSGELQKEVKSNNALSMNLSKSNYLFFDNG